MNAGSPPRGGRLELALPAVPESVRRARNAAAQAARRVGAPEEEVKLAVSEAVGNAVVHAYRDRESGTIALRTGDEGGRFLVTVADDGGGMAPNPASPGLGLGIPLITKLALEVIFDSTERGTAISMWFPIVGEAGSA